MAHFKKNLYQFREQLQIAYLTALCAYSGITLSEQKPDIGSVDVTLVVYDDLQNRISVMVQLKTTQDLVFGDDKTASYSIENKNHNDLCNQKYTPSLLFVLHVPENEHEWIEHNGKELLLRYSMYHYNYANEEKTNQKSLTLKIKKENIIKPNIFKHQILEAHKIWYDKYIKKGEK